MARGAEDVLRLSELLAGSGDLAGAALVLDDLWLRAPERFDEVALSRFALLQLERNEPQEALARARAWISLNPDPDAAVALAAEFSAYNHPDYGLVLLRALPPSERARADVSQLATELRVASGEGEAVFEELLAMEQATSLTETQLLTLVELALSEGRSLIATERAKLLPIEKLPEWTLTSLVEAALQSGQDERAGELFDAIRPQVLAGNPLLAAQLAMRLKRQRLAVRWAVIAESQVEGSEQVVLANLMVQLSLIPRAKALVSKIDVVVLEPSLVAVLARLYLRFGDAQAGLRALERSGDTNSESWALLALAAQEDERVRKWLRRVDNARLTDAGFGELYELAVSKEQLSFADQLAVRGYGLFSNPIWRLRLAEQRLRIGQAEAALALLEGLDHRRLNSEYLYRRALLTAYQAGADVDDALRALASDASTRLGAGTDEARTIAYEFLAAGARVQALPLLRKLASAQPDEWFNALVDTLIEAELNDEAREFMLAQIPRWLEALAAPAADPQSESLTPDQLVARDARFWGAIERLDSLGESQASLELRRQLAIRESNAQLNWMYAYLGALDKLTQNAGVDGTADERLAALNSQAASTLEQRLQSLADTDTAEQVELRSQLALALAQRGGARRALSYLRELAPANDAAEGAYRTALAELGETDELIAHLNRLASRVSPERARVVADELLALGQKSSAEPIYRLAAANLGPKSPMVNQLLFVWGPRPGAGAIEWLLNRMDSAPTEDKVLWGEYALVRGGAKQLAKAMKEGGWGNANAKLALLNLQAIAQSSDKQGLRERVAELIGEAQNTEVLRGIAKLADGQSLPDLAVTAYSELLRALPRDVEALRFRGLNAYDTGNWQEAEEFLKRYHALDQGDFESHYFYAEALSAQGFSARASPVFSYVVKLLERDPELSARERSVLAKSQHRLRRVVAARGTYEKLLRQQPGSRDLRADYADLLQEERSLVRARALLARP